MATKQLQDLAAQLTRLKAEIQHLGPLRPGTLTRQYKHPATRAGAYWQISYTQHRRSRTEYVRPAEVPAVRQQIATYKRLRSLIARWIELGIQHDKLTRQVARKSPAKSSRIRYS